MDLLDNLVEAIEELAVARIASDAYPNCTASSRRADECRQDLKELLQKALD